MTRVAKEEDVRLLGGHIKVGDLIVDSKDKNGNAGHYFISKTYPTIREGATVWIDGSKFDFTTNFTFRNGADMSVPWHISTLTFMPMPGTRVRGKSFTCHGLKRVNVDGYNTLFSQGLYGDFIFLTGNFGFHMSATGGHGWNITLLDGGEGNLNCIEADGGFSTLRLQESALDYNVTYNVNNFYFHDTDEGEGTYIGRTTSAPVPTIKLNLYDGIIARVGAEALQFQHLSNSKIHNITCWNSGNKWLSPFQLYQTTAAQYVCAEGNNVLSDIIIDGYVALGLNVFGSSEGIYVNASVAQNILFNDGIQGGIYLQKSCVNGMLWTFRNLMFGKFNDDLAIVKNGKVEPALIGKSGLATDSFYFDQILHNKPFTFEKNITPKGVTVGKIEVGEAPAPKYNNSGYYEPATRVRQWADIYGVDNVRKGQSVDWIVGDIAIYQKKQYKCVLNYIGTTPPDQLTQYFMLLTWDQKGIRNDQPTHNKLDQQSIMPPDDFRLAKDCMYREMRIGFIEKTVRSTPSFAIDSNPITGDQLVVLANNKEYKIKL